MWRVLFIAILIFFVLLQQLQTIYKKERHSIYSIIKGLYNDKFILITENQKLEASNSKEFSLDLNIAFSQRLSDFLMRLERETKVSIGFSLQEDLEINISLFLQFLISEIVKEYLLLLPLTESTKVNITLEKTRKEYIHLMLAGSFHNTFKINTNYNLLNHIVYAFNGRCKARQYGEKLEIEILLPVVLS